MNMVPKYKVWWRMPDMAAKPWKRAVIPKKGKCQNEEKV
jgi:hypothetical protein